MGILLLGTIVYLCLFIVTAIIITTITRKRTVDESLKKEFT